jgi:hypothetical protein
VRWKLERYWGQLSPFNTYCDIRRDKFCKDLTEDIRRGVEQYVRRWRRWVMSGVWDVSVAFVGKDECPGHPVFVPRILIPTAQGT